MNTPEKFEEYWKVEWRFDPYETWMSSDQLSSFARAIEVRDVMKKDFRTSGHSFRIVRYETTKTVVE